MRKAILSIALGLVLGAFAMPGAQAVGPICEVPSATYPTIQSAVNDPTCQVIIVAPGNYTENVNIPRPVTIDGGGAGLGGPHSTVQSATSGQPVFNIAAPTTASNRVVLQDLRATGAFGGGGGNPDSGVRILAPTPGFLTFQNFTAFMNTGNGIAIDMGAGAALTDIQLSSCDLSRNGNSGFRVPTRVTVSGLNVSGCHMDNNLAIGFTMFGSLLSSTISDSTFNGNGGTPATNSGMGISMHGTDSQPNVVNNLTITDSQASNNAGTHATTNVSTGIQFASRVGDSFTNISILDSEMARNGRQGLRLERAGTGIISNVTVQGNDIENNGQSGISSFDAGAPPPSGILINLNNITGNGVGISNGSSGAFNAECNYWGHPTGPEAVDNPKGKGDEVIEAPGDVDYRPWSPRRIGRGQNPEASCNRGANP